MDIVVKSDHTRMRIISGYLWSLYKSVYWIIKYSIGIAKSCDFSYTFGQFILTVFLSIVSDHVKDLMLNKA